MWYLGVSPEGVPNFAGVGQFHRNGITFREIFFNLHGIAEHILTENLLIIEILLQVMKLVQFQEKI